MQHNLSVGIGLLSIVPIFSNCAHGTAQPKDNGQAADKIKPNVVFFLVDDLGQQDIGCYGSQFYETPNIDAFAGRSVKFNHAYSACNVSSPSRACILTGKYPATLHLTDWLPGRLDTPDQRFLNAPIEQSLPYSEISIAKVLKEHGYATAIYGKWHLGDDPEGPMKHGFDIHIPRRTEGWPNGTYHYPFGMPELDEGSKEGDYLTDRLTDEALKFMDANQDHPFFLFLSHYAVHDPVMGRADLVEKYTKKLAQMETPSTPPYILEGNPDSPTCPSLEERMNMLETPECQGYSQLPDQMVKIKQHQDNVQFAAMVETMDESFGRVMDKLEELGLEDNTIVIFVSDNGGMSAANFFSRARVVKEENLTRAFATSCLPFRGGKGWNYEGGIRVPMMISWPGQGKAGIECDEPVTGTDFYPTILEMLDIPVPAEQKVDGVSLTPLLRGRQHLKRDAIYWHFPHYSNHGIQSPSGAVRCGDYKLIEYYENGTVQLYNLKEDIGEQHDLSQEKPQLTKKLQKKLRDWRKSIHAQEMELNPDYQPAE